MRLIALYGLLAVLMPPSPCERRNLAVCSNDPGFECEDGQYCSIPTGQAVGSCVASECLTGSNTCPADRPFCDRGICTKCVSNVQCSSQSADTPICDASGRCYGCVTSSDCADPAKAVCDPHSHVCRACQLHSECASGVCAKDNVFAALPQPIPMGTCVDPARVNVVTSACADTTCSLPDMLNALSISRPYVLIKALTSTKTVTVPAAPVQNGLPAIYIIGPMADKSPSALTSAPPISLSSGNQALLISAGAHTTLEGLVLDSSTVGLECASGGTQTKVLLIRSFLGANTIAVLASPKCELVIDSSWIGRGPSPQFGTFSGNSQAMQLDGTQLEIVNTVFWHNGAPGTLGGISLSNSTGEPLPSIRIVNSSFVAHPFSNTSRKILAIDCGYPTQGSMSIVNTLFLNSSPPSSGTTYVHNNCRPSGALSGVVSNEAGFLDTDNPQNVADTTLGDSLLVEPLTAGDLHFAASAPSSITRGGVREFIDARGPVPIPSTDMDGRARGPSRISPGAFEAVR